MKAITLLALSGLLTACATGGGPDHVTEARDSELALDGREIRFSVITGRSRDGSHIDDYRCTGINLRMVCDQRDPTTLRCQCVSRSSATLN